MRMVGHQVLLSLGDSTSRVLPIEKKGEDEYQIHFENEFAFNPESVASVIDSVIAATKIASRYIVLFKSCETDQVVHSYEIGRTMNENVLACGTRPQPKACYNLLITILKPRTTATISELPARSENDLTNKYIALFVLLICVLLPMILVPLLLKRKRIQRLALTKTLFQLENICSTKGKWSFRLKAKRLS